jgi:hypothetical protein
MVEIKVEIPCQGQVDAPSVGSNVILKFCLIAAIEALESLDNPKEVAIGASTSSESIVHATSFGQQPYVLEIRTYLGSHLVVPPSHTTSLTSYLHLEYPCATPRWATLVPQQPSNGQRACRRWLHRGNRQ